MHIGSILFVIGMLAAFGVAHDAARADGTFAKYEVFTYDPPCTAAYLDGLKAVTRLTLLGEQHLYVPDGMPMRILIREGQIQDTVQLLLDRPRILNVQRIDPLPDGSGTEWPVQVNPNATTRDYAGNCYPVGSILEWKIHRVLIQRDQGYGASGASAASLPEIYESVYIFVPDAQSIASMVEYLEDNGATIQNSGTKEYKGRLVSGLQANIPISLAASLTERDDFRSMRIVGPIALLTGSETTAGVSDHNADNWHDAGYNGTDVNVGVIDTSFAGIQTAIASRNIPSLADINFRCNRIDTTITGCVGNSEHGTAVAEIVLDMAPAANLFIGRVDDITPGGYDVTDIVHWMVGQDVNVIVSSVTPLIFEGPGDGTTPRPSGTWLDAISLAVRNNMTWVNAAGNENLGTWYAENPGVVDTRFLGIGPTPRIAFANNITTNEVQVYNNTSHWFVLRWDGDWHDINNPPINLDLRLECPNSQPVLGQSSGLLEPQESATYIYVDPNDAVRQCNLIIESPNAQSPGWVQLISFGSDFPNDLQFTTGTNANIGTNSYSLVNNAESASGGMMAVGAVDSNRRILGYSSVGPTIDGRIKPDIVARTGVDTSVDSPFTGTSAATPHVAGLVALYQDLHNNAKTPMEVVSNMTGEALALGTPSPNNIFGYGFAFLPSFGTVTSKPGGNAPDLGVTKTLPDATIHQGRNSVYGVFARDSDRHDTLTFNATSSNSSAVGVIVKEHTIYESNIREYYLGTMYLNPQSPGTATITVDISDGANTLTESFGVTVTKNHYPDIGNVRLAPLIYPASGAVSLSASDVDGDDLRYDHLLPPDTTEVRVSLNQNVLTATPQSDIVKTVGWDTGAIWRTPILVSVYDTSNAWDYAVISACVAKGSESPDLNTIPGQIVRLSGSAAVSVSASDADGDRMMFVTPVPDDTGIAQTSLSGGGLLQLGRVNLGHDVTSLSIRSLETSNDTAVSATLTARDSFGNTLLYSMDSANPVLHVPDSVIPASNNYGCPHRQGSSSTHGAVVKLVGLSVGNTTVPLTVVDSWGRSDTQNFTVTVLPGHPTITLSGLANMTISLGSAYVEPGYSATDPEDGNITGNVTVTGAVNTTALGTYVLSYGVTDSSGNPAITQNRTVRVVPDAVPPVIVLSGPTNMTISFGAIYAEPGYSAADDVDGNITGNVTVTGAVNTTALGTYVLSYGVTDSSGNPAITQNRTIHVADRTAPTITLSGSANMTISFGSAYVEPGYLAADNVDGNITGNVTVTGAVNASALGTYTISYDVTDSSGNSATTQNRTVRVVPDAVPPVIVLSGSANMTISFGSAYVEPGYSAADDVDGNITGNVTVTGAVNTTALGTYVLSYGVTDSAGNPAITQNRTIHVADRTAPTITLSGSTNMTISFGSAYVEPGYSAADNVDGNITGNVTVTGAVNASALGTYTISYDVTDSSGNPAITQNRTITVTDMVPPVIVLSGPANMTISFGSAYVEPGYSAADNVDGNLTGNVTVTGAVNTTALGTYVLSYGVTDSSGNPAITQNRTIHVADITKPVIVLSGTTEIVLEYRDTYREPGYSATDDMDGDITGKVKVTGGNIDGRVIGTYTISYDVTDSAGNKAITQNRTVRVADITKPVITLAGSVNIVITAGSTYAEPGYSAADDVDGVITGRVNVTGAVNVNKSGVYTLSYDVTDSAGNKAITQNRTIHVTDSTRPVIVLSGPTEIVLNPGIRFQEPGYAATDDTDGDITAKVTTKWISTGTSGTFIYAYDVIDNAGNHAVQQTRMVTFLD